MIVSTVQHSTLYFEKGDKFQDELTLWVSRKEVKMNQSGGDAALLHCGDDHATRSSPSFARHNHVNHDARTE